MTILIGTGTTGNAVHQGQQMAKSDDFGKVSKRWLDKCMTYQQAMEQISLGHAQTEDIMATTRQMVPLVNAKNEFVMRHQDGREYRPTEFAIKQMSAWAKCGQWFATSLMENPENAKGQQLFARDRGDAETLANVFQNGFRRINPAKPFLWRTRQDGTMRAMLTDKYAIINNEWFLSTLKSLVPGGMVSHWRGDVDSIFSNILIPDSIRQENDSDYGGMLSISNSEIGQRELSSRPSVFRAICQNGCIWDKTSGCEISVRHSGNIDLVELYAMLKKNLEEQIPLLPQGIDRLLGTRSCEWDGASMKPLFAQVSRQFKMSKRQATALLGAYESERGNTLFNVINAVTRAGQKLSNAEWVRLDAIGGDLANYDHDDWFNLTKRAKNLKLKEVEGCFSIAS